MSVEADIISSDGYFQGEDKQIIFSVLNSSGGPQDVTGWTTSFRLSDTKGATNFTGFPVAGTVTDGPLGLITVTIPSATTLTMTGEKNYFYTFRRTNAGFRNELSFGTVFLRQLFVQ